MESPRLPPMRLGGGQHRCRATHPGLTARPVGADRGQLLHPEHPVLVVEVLNQAEPRVSCPPSPAAPRGRGRMPGGRRMDVDDVGHGVAPVQRAQHGHHGSDAAAACPEQELGRRRIGQDEFTLGEREPDDGSRGETAYQVLGQESLGHRLDRDGQLPGPTPPTTALVGRADRVRAPVPPPVDVHADADVLAGLVAHVPAPARPDDEGGGVGGLRDHLDDLPSAARGRTTTGSTGAGSRRVRGEWSCASPRGVCRRTEKASPALAPVPRAAPARASALAIEVEHALHAPNQASELSVTSRNG